MSKKWIPQYLYVVEVCSEECQPLSEDDVKALAEEGNRIILFRVRHYVPLIGIVYKISPTISGYNGITEE